MQNTNIEEQSEKLFEEAFNQAQIAYKAYKDEDYCSAKEHLSKALNIFVKLESIHNVSICMSWLAFFDYKMTPESYFQVIKQLNEAKFLSEKTDSQKAKFLNEYIFTLICINEKDFVSAKHHFEELQSYNIEDDEFLMEEKKLLENSIQNKSQDTGKQQKVNLHHSSDPLIALMKIARTVTAQTNLEILLTTIAEETKNTLDADRCTVFLLDKESNELWSKIALGMKSQTIRFPADKGLAGHVAMTGETIIIDDAYNDDRFNKAIDNETGYTTKTMLCMPIRNMQHEIIGVFQVLNKLKGTFTKHDEDLLIAIGSSAGIALENASLFEHQQYMLEEQRTLFSSFIDTLAASIDARDKITAGHSTRVKWFSMLIAEKLNLPQKTAEEIELAAILHDIGKIGIKDSVLQKEGRLTDEEYKHIQQHVQMTHDILSKIYLSDEYKNVAEIASSHHEKFDGSGYFRHLQGEQIHIGGRVLAVSDVFDAITSRRHYRDKMPIDKALSILKKDSGTHFDKTVVDAFFSLELDKLIEVFLTEYESGHMSDNDKEYFHKYMVNDIYQIATKHTNADPLTQEEQNLFDLFIKYYDNKSKPIN